MSREIKFRAWDKVNKKMRSSEELFNLDCSNELPFLPLAKGLYDEDENGYSADFEVMQYTGLRDKNGRDIYEGDILKRTLLPSVRLSSISIVKWIPAKACLSSADMDGRNVTFISDYINSNYELEVIGNIYENPELLKGGAK